MLAQFEIDTPPEWEGCDVVFGYGVPKKGQWYLTEVYGWTKAIDGMSQPWLTATVTPRWKYPSDKLPGSVCITCNRDGSFTAWKDVPQVIGNGWCRGLPTCVLQLTPFVCDLIGITLPPSTGDWRKDIWLNPEHPANKERNDA